MVDPKHLKNLLLLNSLKHTEHTKNHDTAEGSPTVILQWRLLSFPTIRSLCSGPGTGLIVHHHWDTLKQVCWAKAAPVPAAFVLAQDSANSRWQSNTFIKNKVGMGEDAVTAVHLLFTCSWETLADSREAFHLHPGAEIKSQCYRECAFPETTSITEWVMKTALFYLLNLVYAEVS